MRAVIDEMARVHTMVWFLSSTTFLSPPPADGFLEEVDQKAFLSREATRSGGSGGRLTYYSAWSQFFARLSSCFLW